MDVEDDFDFDSVNCDERSIGDFSKEFTENIEIASENRYSDSIDDFESTKIRAESNEESASPIAGGRVASNLREIRLTTIIDQLRINNRLKGAEKFRGDKPKQNENGSVGGDQSGLAGTRARPGRRRAAPLPLHNGAHEPHINNNNNNNNNNNTLHPSIKNERLSPHAATDRSSSRSRSVTPSTGSFPGTPPQTGTGTGSGDRGSSPAHPHTALLGAGVPPPPPQHVARNYSDFMRNLAAKYNTPTPNDFYSGARPMVSNGFSIGPNMDPRFALKSPFSLLAPPVSGAPPQIRSSPPPPIPEIRDRPIGGIFSGYSYAQGGPRNVPAFPSSMEMTSTKALLAIARAANVAKEVELASNFMKGATKRPPGNSDANPLSSPLDLSSAAGTTMFSSSPSAKKSRLSPKHESNLQNESGSSTVSCGDAGDLSPSLDCKPNTISESNKSSDSRNGRITPMNKCEKSQRLSAGRARSEATSPASFGRKSPASSGRKSPASRDCGGCCRDGRRDCGQSSDPEVATWTVDDVCKFVESIDICAEYSPMFREQRIDGSGLPLLTEDHLTGLLRMKLGPALKMKATLAGRLGNCQHHCRCRSTPTPNSAPCTSPPPETTPTASGSQVERNSGLLVKMERPSSTDSNHS